MRMISTAAAALALGAIMATPALAAAAGEYVSGHGALEVFDGAAFETTPTWVKVWLGIMLVTFASSIVFVRRHVIARWAFGGFLASFFLNGPLFQLLGLPVLSGSIAIAHLLFWTPVLVLLLKHRPFLEPDEPRAYRFWSGAMTFVILFSFVFDIRDAVIYVGHVMG